LDDQPWSALAARAERLHDPARRDFGRIRMLAAGITADLEAHRRRKIDETLDRIAERAQDNPVVADAADRLGDLARQGEIASAEEYLEQALAGGALPELTDDVDHRRRFFPAVPSLAAAQPDLLEQVHSALSGSRGGTAVAALADAGVTIEGLSDARREAGRRARGSWWALGGRGGRKQGVDAAAALRAVLAQAGLEFREVRVHHGGHAGRQWVTLTGVSGAGKALTPALGSAMSPDAATLRVLLVRDAPTPATVI